MPATITAHPYAIESARNYALNANVRTDLTGWSTSGTVTGGGAGVADRVPTSDVLEGACPEWNMRLEVTTATSTIACNRGSSVAQIIPGNVYTVAGYVYKSNGGNARLWVSFKDSAGTTISSSTVTKPLPAGTWTKITSTGTCPPGANNIVFEIGVDSGAAVGENIYTACVTIVDGATAAAVWFDGARANTAAAEYRWVAEPNTSASIKAVPAPEQVITPDIVQAPWVASRESLTVLHVPLDEPAYPRATLRDGAADEGEFLLMFPSQYEAWDARRQFTAAQSFTYDDAGQLGYTMLDRFVITPGSRVEMSQTTENGELLRHPTTGEPVWQLRVPWTQVAR